MAIKNQEANRFVSLLGIILLIMAIALTYTSKIVDVDKITAPFEEAIQGTIVGDWIDEAKQRELERELEESENPAQELAQQIKDFTGLSKLQTYYIQYQSMLEKFENSVAEIPNKFLIAISILLLFTIKAFVVLVPISATCLITSLLFPFKVACLINLGGYIIIFTIKYFWGRHIGEGYVSKILKHSKFLYKLIQDEENGYGTGNPLLLFLLRLVPTVPINPISAMYGHMGYDFLKYLLLSVFGISLRLVSVTAIGANVDDPFSRAFVLPLIILLYVSGLSMFVLSEVLRRRNKATLEAEKEEKRKAEEEAQFYH